MKKVPYNPLVPAMNKSRKAKKMDHRNNRRSKDKKKSWERDWQET